ncbi:hypothetical protein FACS189490_06400 [Clostridia bacterium]|nr:hypothetical protein FACS189490_06400 [Clostridia bacterium]
MYGRGRLFVITIPDDYGGLYNYPCEILSNIRKQFCANLPVTLSGQSKIALFAYDNNTFALHSFNGSEEQVTFTVKGEGVTVRDLIKGTVKQGVSKDGKTAFEDRLMPGVTKVYKIV